MLKMMSKFIIIFFLTMNVYSNHGQPGQYDLLKHRKVNSINLIRYFSLFTQQSVNTPRITTNADLKLFGGHFNSSKSTIFLVPGYNNTPERSSFFATMKSTYLPEFDVNLIIIFWESGIPYTESRHLVVNVALTIAKFLKRMVFEESLNLNVLTVIGHSMGAHIAGTAGRILKGILQTIVGLDPANPLFKPGGPDSIDSRSASFVQIIHTGGNEKGQIEPAGDVDFYANGGLPPQPGCENDAHPPSCSHSRSFQLYAETVKNPHAFLATKCSDYATYLKSSCSSNPKDYVGQNCSRSARGAYFFRTTSTPPYYNKTDP